MVAGAMTDPKGHRSKRPAEQDDPDQFVRVVERRADGVVIRGAKLHNTGGINSHEILVLPGTAMKDDEKDYAIACAVPADAEGVIFIFGRQTNDPQARSGCRLRQPRFGVVGGEAMIVFDDVFVPNERIFLNGETDQCGKMVTYSRRGIARTTAAASGQCRRADRATAKTTRILGTEKNGVVKDKLIEMVHLTETTYGTAVAASFKGYQLPCGSFMVIRCSRT
jgi:4-hydroxybutyryl-CoA dehydratase/vinylacetyl-CoA-Delta-isomerase